MARPDENPIRAPRDLSEDFQNAADPAGEPREVDKPELEYRPPEPSAPGFGGGDRPQSEIQQSTPKPLQTAARASSKASAVDLSPSADHARSMVRQTFNREAREMESEVER
jgi:hypothetical protein